jgi:acyl-coenzyme A synthetase/AMP-(fatty) acid ligase
MIKLANRPIYPITFFACASAGLIAVPVSNQLTARETADLIEDCGASVLAGEIAGGVGLAELPGTRIIGGDALEDWSRTFPPVSHATLPGTTPAYMVYTSGTTARPKGVLHAHRAVWGRRPMREGWYGLRPDDRVLHAGDFNWTFTLGTGLMDPWMAGATAIVYAGRKAPEVWAPLIEASQATLFAAVPGLFRQILKSHDGERVELPSLRHGIIAGETPPPGLVAKWKAATGCELYEALGMSEISTYISSGPSVPPKPGRVGKPQAGRAVAILPEVGGNEPVRRGEEGLIAVHRSDPGLMLGYWNRPEEEAEVFRGEWFIGGDLGLMDAEGYIAHRGRANDVIKALGYRIAPQEVEAALREYAGVGEAACVAEEVKPGVFVLVAYIVAQDRAHPPAEAEIQAHAEARLAAYKRPRIIRLIEALPKTRNGKLQRSALVNTPEAGT